MEFVKSKLAWIKSHKKESWLIVLMVFVIVGAELGIKFRPPLPQAPRVPVKPLKITSSTNSNSEFTIYKSPKLAKAKKYNIYLIGDSMTHAFGPRGGIFSELINKAYPGTFFEVSNYAHANESILLLPDNLKTPVQADKDLLLKPILEGNPDLIIIESFGYNPLSQFGLKGGIEKQNEYLTEIMTTLTNRFPNTAIMFFTAIAPDKKTYGMNITHATEAERWAQAEERIDYITNHRDYAIEHRIPLIDAYQASLDSDGDGDTKYINPDDNIHPSEEGLALMARVMVKTIQEDKIFPK
ncbi:MAG TPA: GDSL-type esterase/lipase family protein [Patescibacteria group bacterium]|nr:GDSL-type esterase/lipase family protein [Patescibacteria group bacterium]